MPARLDIDLDAFREMWLAGESLQTIEAHFGVSKVYAQRLRRKLNLPPRENSQRVLPQSEAVARRRDKVRAMHSAGSTNKQMLEALGLSAKSGYTTLANDLKALNLRRIGGQSREESIREFNERLNGSPLAQACTTSCADCGSSWHGSLAETRGAFRAHACVARRAGRRVAVALH